VRRRFLCANVLHYTHAPDTVLAHAAALLKPDGRIVVIEYERRVPTAKVLVRRAAYLQSDVLRGDDAALRDGAHMSNRLHHAAHTA